MNNINVISGSGKNGDAYACLKDEAMQARRARGSVRSGEQRLVRQRSEPVGQEAKVENRFGCYNMVEEIDDAD